MRRLRFMVGALLVAVWTVPLGAQETGSIRGRVVDDASQRPIPGVAITVGSLNARTQADGGYLIAGVPTGTDTLRTRLLGYAPAMRTV